VCSSDLVLMIGDPKLAAYLRDILLPALRIAPELSYTSVGAPGQRLRIVTANHPVFRGLDAAALTTLTEVAWRRWFRMNDAEGEVLLTLVGDDPLVVAHTLERGRVVIFASDLHLSNGDFAGSPMALPFWQRLTAWLAANRSAVAVNTTVGDDALLQPKAMARDGGLAQTESIMVHRTADESSAAAEITWRHGQPYLNGGRIDRAGFVVFTTGARSSAHDTLGVVAAGIPVEESILQLRTPIEFGALLADWDLKLDRDLTERDPAEFETALGGHDISGWLLALALLLLLVELGVGRGARP